MAKSFFGLFQNNVEDDALANVKAVNAWIGKLSGNDPMGVVMAMTRLLEEQSTRRPTVTPGRIQALLALDRLSLDPLSQLQVQYRISSLSDDVRQNLWHARNDLARWFAYAYEQYYEGIRNEPDRHRFQSVLNGVFSRMFYHRGLQAKQGLLRYEQWIPAKWKFLHAAYKEALDLGLATSRFALNQSGSPVESCSAEQEYIHFLLMQRINTGNLSVLQIDVAAVWLREWLPELHLAPAPVEGDRFWILDLGKAEGLLPPAAKELVGPLLYLDVSPLAARLTELKAVANAQLGQGGTRLEVRELKERLALANRLDLLWLPNAKHQTRRGERRVAEQPVLVAAGWGEIAVFMREARPWKPHDPYHYTYDSTADLITLGRSPARKEQNDLAGNLHPDRRGWRIHDVSDTGCRVLSTTRHAAQLQIGALLALLRESDTRWRVAIVRRLRRRTAEHTELGLEIIAESSLLVMPEPVATRDSGYSVNSVDISSKGRRFDALYIPPQQLAKAPVYSMVLPVAEYAAGKQLVLTLDGQQRIIRLAVTVEYDKDWVWSTFDVVGSMPGGV